MNFSEKETMDIVFKRIDDVMNALKDIKTDFNNKLDKINLSLDKVILQYNQLEKDFAVHIEIEKQRYNEYKDEINNIYDMMKQDKEKLEKHIDETKPSVQIKKFSEWLKIIQGIAISIGGIAAFLVSIWVFLGNKKP